MSLALEAGRTHALFGRNGAGKSTFLQIAATLLKPTSGELLYDGKPLEDVGSAVRSQIGLVSHQSFAYPDLTVVENLEFYRELYGASGGVDDAVAWADLDFKRNAPVRSLSRGMLQRLSIARALLHRPRLLLLDEPFTGLDAASAGRLTRLLSDVRDRGTAVLFTTHQVALGVPISDRVWILEAGRLAFDATGATVAEVERLLLEAQQLAG